MPDGPWSVTSRPPWQFEAASAQRRLCEQFGVRDLTGFGCAGMALAIGAAGALLQYAQDTQLAALPHLRGLRVQAPDAVLVLDPATRRNLEIDRSLSGDERATLVGVLDACVGAMGSRQLRRWLLGPIRDHTELRRRYAAIAVLLQDQAYVRVQEGLRGVGDVERILGRVALRSARPRDLAALRDSLGLLPGLAALLADFEAPLLADLRAALPGFEPLHELLCRAVEATPPALLRDGGVIAAGFDAQLDDLRSIGRDAGAYLLELEQRERERTGIASLKVSYNRVHGYYIELSRAQAATVPADYTRRQTLKNAERYLTPELKSFEERALGARERALARERLLFEQLLDAVTAELAPLQAAASALAQLDALACLAERADRFGYVEPQLDEAPGIHIDGGRHPVVERLVDEPFVDNDLELDDRRRILLITGPNMGGKSTYMRQVALIVLLAHAGSYVPARAARIGPVDRIFTRIGAADDVAGGRSTFMVEMTETANILHNATDRSLVLLDEVGRGTSTYDGLALAWALSDAPGAAGAGVHAVCHALLRADGAGAGARRRRQRAPGRGRTCRRHRVSASRAAGAGAAQLWPAGGGPGRRAGGGAGIGQRASGAAGRGPAGTACQCATAAPAGPVRAAARPGGAGPAGADRSGPARAARGARSAVRTARAGRWRKPAVSPARNPS